MSNNPTTPKPGQRSWTTWAIIALMVVSLLITGLLTYLLWHGDTPSPWLYPGLVATTLLSIGAMYLLTYGVSGINGKNGDMIGLDIGTSSIKLVQVTATPTGPKVVQYGIIPTPKGAVAEGAVQPNDRLLDAIQQLLNDRKIKQRRLVTAIGQNLIIRHINFPKMTHKELQETLKWEAEQHIPIPKGECVWDYYAVPAAEAEEKMQVVLVATYRKPIEQYIELLRNAGLRPVAVDIEPLAALRATHPATTSKAGVVVITDLGSRHTTLSIFSDGILQMTRMIPIGGNDLTEAIAEGLNLTWEQAEQVKKQEGLHNLSAVQLSILAERLAGEIRRSLEFFLFKNRDQHLAGLHLVGGGAKLEGLPELLAGELRVLADKLGWTQEMPITIAHPSQHFTVAEPIAAEFAMLETILAPALGLALREMES